jgi:hypothetical protein
MELSLRLDILGGAEVHFLNSRERFRDWPPFVLLAASRQAQIFAYMSRDVVEHLHQQIVAIEEATGLDSKEDEEEENPLEEAREQVGMKSTDRGEGSAFSPSLAQALDKLNELARQHLPEDSGGTDPAKSNASGETELLPTAEEDALEQLQDAFIQMMEVVRDLAAELSTDALQLTSRFRCMRTDMSFIPTGTIDEEALAEIGEGEEKDLEIELVLMLQLFEEGHARPDDLPAVELQLDREDFENLHETIDYALSRDKSRRGRR